MPFHCVTWRPNLSSPTSINDTPDTEVRASFDGMILFPDAGAGPNQEWFYLSRPNPDFDVAA